ncbi:tyrosine-type recombinase/integrase [Devosia sp. CN2-171]|uniref:tyrosine-type recombinase/integrase n=1 Tax=Devosia sp. CN2-171 TaxID=3400909 RepID=UPI003BF8E267
MDTAVQVRRPWNKGLTIGQKRPLLPRQVWSIRVRLEMSGSPRDLALFNLAIDSKLRASDLVRLKTEDICSGALVRDRGVVVQQKTGRPVQFEVTEVTRQSVERLLASQPSDEGGHLFRSRSHRRPHISSRQYARIVHRWISNIGLDDRGFGTHSLRRTKVAQLYRKTGNLRAVQLLLGHAKIETTVRYLGVEVDDALRLAEQIEL